MNFLIFETPVWAWMLFLIGVGAFLALIIASLMAPEGYEDETGYHDGTECEHDYLFGDDFVIRCAKCKQLHPTMTTECEHEWVQGRDFATCKKCGYIVNE